MRKCYIKKNSFGFLIAICALMCVMLIMGSRKVLASDNLPIDGFYDYDMETQEETFYTITVPDGSDSELEMEGYQGDTDTTVISEFSTKTTAQKTKVTSKWIKKNGYYYYVNRNGKLLKNGIYTIKGNRYWFDKKGRRKSGTYKSPKDGFYYVFSKKNGKLISQYIYLEIESIDRKNKNVVALTYKNPGSSIGFSVKNVKIVNKKGKAIKLARLKTGDLVKVYTKSRRFLETDPMQFSAPVTKVQFVRHLT